MAEIEKFSVRVAAVHGAQHPEMIVLRDLFADFKAEMELHLLKEERVLFPYIRLLENGAEKDAPVCFSDVGGPIRMMLFEHENAGEDLRKMREVTSDYTLPQAACNTYRLLFHKLQELEEDVHLHMHLENNLLFPRAMELAANPG
jgi:regulator of cell morphogenesis and NO signaling